MPVNPFRWLDRLHLSDRELVRFLDPERRPAPEDRTSRHLGRCERCRLDLARMEGALLDIALAPGLHASFDLSPAPRRVSWRWAVGLTSVAAVAGSILTFALFPDAAPVRTPPGFPVVAPEPRASGPAGLSSPPFKRVAAANAFSGAPLPGAIERDSAEIDARYAVHTACECLGQPLEVTTRNGRIRVEGVVTDFRRRDAVAAALQGMTNVELKVRTYEESAESRFFPCGPRPGAESEASADGGAEFSRQLIAYFAPGGERAAFAAVPLAAELALHDSRTAVVETQALQKLAGRYPVAVCSRLPPRASGLLRTMVTDYVTRIESHMTMWRDVADAAAGGLASPPGRIGREQVSTASAPWQAEVAGLGRAVEIADTLTRRLLGGKSLPQEELAKAAASLHAVLAELGAHCGRTSAGLALGSGRAINP
ncbi:MAG: hypothetical protein FJW40_27605 [Acidobacteria bacterium]|nr:hypothetical protein [Acidobacteriota bacterium]